MPLPVWSSSMLYQQLGSCPQESVLSVWTMMDKSSLLEMYEERANFQSLYKRAGSSLSDSFRTIGCALSYWSKRSNTSTISCKRGFQISAVGDSRATGRGNSSDVFSHRVGSTGIPQGRVVLCAHQPMDNAGGNTSFDQSAGVTGAAGQLDRETFELREDLEHKRNRCINFWHCEPPFFGCVIIPEGVSRCASIDWSSSAFSSFRARWSSSG